MKQEHKEHDDHEQDTLGGGDQDDTFGDDSHQGGTEDYGGYDDGAADDGLGFDGDESGAGPSDIGKGRHHTPNINQVVGAPREVFASNLNVLLPQLWVKLMQCRFDSLEAFSILGESDLVLITFRSEHFSPCTVHSI